jgi:CRP-like cAMP-binding protein
MSFPKVLFKVVENNNCPLFSYGDEFTVTGITIPMTNAKEQTCFSTVILTSPLEKERCQVLNGDLTKILMHYERADKIPVCVLSCSGCTGSLRLEYSKQNSLEDMEMHDVSNTEALDAMLPLLSRFDFFKLLEEKKILKVAQYFKVAKFAAGDIILRKGDRGTNFFIIVKGKVHVLNKVGITITTLKQGDVFGEMSLICNDPVSATIQVDEPALILSIDRAGFQKILEQYPSLQLYFTRLMARRLNQSNRVRAQDLSSGMNGNLNEIPPEALFQILNMNQKTGILTINDLPQGVTARFSFRQGALIKAKYGDAQGEEAFYKILRETEGHFRFTPGIPAADIEAPEIGYFMKLLMEGMRRLDEERSRKEV